MKPEFNSKRLFGITRSKGKMYELGLPEDSHISIPEKSDPQELFMLTIGTLGDVAAILSNSENIEVPLAPNLVEDLSFSASFFDAFLESRLAEKMDRDVMLLASSAYYLNRRPGSSLILARNLQAIEGISPVEKLLHWILLAEWNQYPNCTHALFGESLTSIGELVALHFYNGSSLLALNAAIASLRHQAYESASARDLLFIDVIAATARIRTSASAWVTLPKFSGISAEAWAPAIQRPGFPVELWPSQMLLGHAGIFGGASGVIQMPTSAGKTRSVEIILRSGFLASRTKLAIVVAPFRALCHEIGTTLRNAFREDDVKVNELSDAMQLDFIQEIADFFGTEAPQSKYILVLTPEKLLYVLRQKPTLISDIGIVIYDEGHQFDSGSRGVIYELLLTEIKALLSTNAQTVLVSAVIQNAEAIGEWLIGENAKIVNGRGLMPTSRSVAFASWLEKLGQLMFFESEVYSAPDYFVPRVIEQQLLNKLRKETSDRYFPIKDESNDIALYMGFRLVSQGAVAIFCGRKDTAANMASRAVDIYERGFMVSPPAASADPLELAKMKNLVDRHFGEASVLSRAVTLGVLVHHGNTPQGIRLSIEYGMQKGLFNFVACTSTLAQGVNLPIRYLIVSSIQQGAEKISVRDFQNLLGRAGRSGMHTEGLVIFSDPTTFDRRNSKTDSWRFKSSVELLSPENSSGTTSSLLSLISPLWNNNRTVSLQIAGADLAQLILSEEDTWLSWAMKVVELNPHSNFEVRNIISELRSRRRLMTAVESYLMANRGTSTLEEFRPKAENLARSTLAYHLAAVEAKPSVIALFLALAEHLHQEQPSNEKQAAYAKTLLGIKNAKAVEDWVNARRNFLFVLNTNEAWIDAIWPLFESLSEDKFFSKVQPSNLAIQLAHRWVRGVPFHGLIALSKAMEGSKPWGEKRRKLNDDDIVHFCVGTLGFDCALILAAVSQFLIAEIQDDEDPGVLNNFQKALKYGLPDRLSISCYEVGFADRVIAHRLSETVQAQGFSDQSFVKALKVHGTQIHTELNNFPSYFQTVFASLN